MDQKRAEQRTAHTLCKKCSLGLENPASLDLQTRRAAATWRFAIKLPLLLLWLLVYLPHKLWLHSCFARLPLSLCFCSTAPHGLLLLSLLRVQSVPLFIPESSNQIQPSPLHHRQLPPMLDFSLLLMSSSSPAHGSCIMSWKTLLCSGLCKGSLQRSSSCIHSVLMPHFFCSFSLLCDKKQLFVLREASFLS